MQGTENYNLKNFMDMDDVCSMQEYMHRLQFFDDVIDEYIYIYNITKDRIYFTDKIRKKFPIPPAGFDGNDFDDWSKIIYIKDKEYVEYARHFLIEDKIDFIDMVYRVVDREGNDVWISVKGTVRKVKDSKLLIGSIGEMSQKRLIDPLTGLCHSEKLLNDLKQYKSIEKGFLMILDIDNFKKINIAHGRSTGDDILKKVAGIMEKYAQHPMGLYRLYGDRFGIIFPNKEEKDLIQFYNYIKYGMVDDCTISAGVISYDYLDYVDGSTIIQYAEDALDSAKKKGKNQLYFFSMDKYKNNLDDIELLDEMSASINNNFKGFYLCYQPQVKSGEYNICGVEALLRYNSISKGNLNPAKFIHLLEESRLISIVGEWVLKSALIQCKEWRKCIPDLSISVNISNIQLQEENFVNKVLDLLEEVDISGEALVLEITESMQLDNYNKLNKVFYALKQYGIKISMDDFGTGFSNLSYLRSIEIDEIKIDRCFVKSIQHNVYNFQLIKNMIELASCANIMVCCEGVESIEELIALEELKPDIYQGYLFARPYTKEEFEQAYIFLESKEYKEREAKECELLKSNLLNIGEKKLFEKEKIGNIVDSMDEVIYVSDIDTYELYYMNYAGRQITGTYDYKGRKCYEILQGSDEPCKFCNNQRLQKNKFYTFETENTFLNKKYLVKDKLIQWQDKLARLEIAIDISEGTIDNIEYIKKTNYEILINEFYRLLFSKMSRHEKLKNLLRILGEFSQGCRAYILNLDMDSNIYYLDTEWYAKGENSISRHFPMVLKDIKEEYSEQRISAWIMKKNEIVGLIGIDNPKYFESVCELVKMVAYFLELEII